MQLPMRLDSASAARRGREPPLFFGTRKLNASMLCMPGIEERCLGATDYGRSPL